MALQHLEQGRALLENQDLNAAILELSEAASANPKLSEASTLLGVAYWRKGLRDLAERSFENAVRLNKDDAQNLNNLGFLHYENQDYEKATKYFKRAAKLSPNDPRIWNNLGMAQSERGKFDDAYESFVHAQGEYKGHLNVAARLERSGDTRKAIRHLEQAVALQPNSPEVLVKLINLYNGKGEEKLAQNARGSLEKLRTVAKTNE
jgi:Flp pilus assembly protein TadD